MVVDDAVVIQGWAKEGRRAPCRELRLTGRLDVGSTLGEGQPPLHAVRTPIA